MYCEGGRIQFADRRIESGFLSGCKKEEVMRPFVITSALSALALIAVAVSTGSATAAKSKMGCERGKEKWDAAAGKCVAGKSKYAGQVAAKKAPAKKAPAKK
jgi:hypothetical protein